MQNLLFLNAGIFWSHIFIIGFMIFGRNLAFLPADGGKRAGCICDFYKKGSGCSALQKSKTWTPLNFVKSLFSHIDTMWRVHFSYIEFCEMSINGLSFPLDRPLRIIKIGAFLKSFVWTCIKYIYKNIKSYESLFLKSAKKKFVMQSHSS